MNRNRPSRNRPAPQKPDDVDSLIHRMERLHERVVQCNDISPRYADHVKSLLTTAVFILSTQDENEGYEDEQDSDDDDDEDPGSIPSSSRTRLDLRKRWAGSLPTVDSFAASKQRKAPEGPEESVKLTPKEYLKLQKRNAERIAALKDTNGIAGGHPDVYETTYDFGPDHRCQCGSKLIDHKVDKNLPVQQTSEGPMQAYILCDRTRAYIPVP
jgi:hypothetical protein